MKTSSIPVLLVEDNPGDARLIREALAEAGPARFELTATDRLAPALQLLIEGRFEVVLLDLSLPDSHGLETFRAVRAETHEVPVVVLTGLADQTLAVQAVQEGAQDYLVKGEVSSAQLAHALYYAVGRHQRQRDVESALRASEEEMRVARQIQQHLFPAAAPARPGFDVHGASFCAAATGGDFFDYLPLGDEALGLVIADVTGHGVGPALLMAATRAYLRAFAQTSTDPGRILALTNRVLAADLTEGRNVTLLLARLDTAARTLLYTSAGHPPGWVIGSAGQVRHSLLSTDMPLGIRPDGDFPTAPALALAPGDVVLLLTDGVLEERSPEGEQFGQERAVAVVAAHRRSSARDIVEALYAEVRRFSRDRPQADDITALVVKVGAAI
jgi:serine phosphatase RsbU (regulator of sigma subunit)